MPHAKRLILLLLALSVAWAAPAQDAPRERPLVPFRLENEEGRPPAYVLGENRFQREQLARFVVGIETFLRRAHGAPPGRPVVWRVTGDEGYLALSTSPFADGPRYLLSLRGETIRPIHDEEGVLAMASLMGILLLEPARATPPPSLSEPRELTR